MKYINGQYADLEMARFEIETILGFPKMPDTIGCKVDPANVQPIEHAYAIIESQNGFVLTVDEEFEALATNTQLSTQTLEFLAVALPVATETFEQKESETLWNT